MKSKNNDTGRITERLSTFFSSIVTKARTIRASSKDYWKEYRREIFLALVLLASLFLVPLLLCVTASAEEPDLEMTESKASREAFPVTESPTPYRLTDVIVGVPRWQVFTSAGSYSTATSPYGVYAYFTSNNNPKASTRTSTSYHPPASGELDYVVTRAFIFKNHSTSPSSENTFKFSYDCFDLGLLSVAGARFPSDSFLRFSTSYPFNVTYRAYAVRVNDSPDTNGHYVYEGTIEVSPDDDTINVWEITDYIYDDYEADELSSSLIYRYEFLVSSEYFSGTKPDDSYVDVYCQQYSSEDLRYYQSAVSSYLNRYTENLQYREYLGFLDGKSTGYDIGYTTGHTEGYNLGLSQQFEPGWFVRGVDAFLNIRLFEYRVNNIAYTFTLGTIFSIAVGGTALLWFIKIFAGG